MGTKGLIHAKQVLYQRGKYITTELHSSPNVMFLKAIQIASDMHYRKYEIICNKIQQKYNI